MSRMLSLAALGLALIAVAPLDAAAAEPELEAVLSVMGYGYKVKVLVNGADTGVRGGKSESKRLFNKSHPMVAKASPDIRASHFLLKPGANEVAIEYSKTDPKAADRLEITLEAEGYPQPLLRLVNRGKPSDKLSVKLQIEKAAPASFKPVAIGDEK
ncbi:MAG: hypothetical protein A3F74_02080 [Betaproteobacteria bacterium RIFCSPLOWO2_12_FULL_62_58]|nr:MAG: hypothetical protein A3F74_02080 [Betaproteobacteria bacterium RIFCSPLOWO2_12_FULL_62_58]